LSVAAVEGKEVEGVDEVKDAMENMRIEMSGVVKEKILKEVSEEAAGEYESSREIAMREALVKASEISKMENEDRKLAMTCNQIKEQYFKKHFQLLYLASSQEVMVTILN
jgi:hypothetical protein